MDAHIALSLNMQAIVSHNEGDYQAAIRRYRSAVEQTLMSAETKFQMSRRGSLAHSMSPQSQLSVEPCCPGFVQVVQHTGDSIVSGPFLVSTDGSASIFHVSDHDASVLSLALLFNMALSFHLRSLESAKVRSLDLRRAMFLYKSAMKIVQECPRDFTNPSEALLVVAVGNNLCIILSDLYEHKKVKKIMDFTMHFWLFTTEGNTRFFPRNTISWGLAPTQSAACA